MVRCSTVPLAFRRNVVVLKKQCSIEFNREQTVESQAPLDAPLNDIAEKPETHREKTFPFHRSKAFEFSLLETHKNRLRIDELSQNVRTAAGLTQPSNVS